MDYSGADTGGAGAAVDGCGTTSGGTKNKHSGPLPSLGDSSGVAFLLGNHSKFGLAERCCYHFDLIETLTSQPAGRVQQPQTRTRRRDRGLSISSQDGAAAITTKDSNLSSSGVSSTSTQLEGGDNVAVKKSSSKMNSSSSSKSSSASNESNHCFCGVVSLLECVPGSSGAERSAGGGSIGGGAQPDRSMKRTLRSKIREFNSRAQVAWGRSTRGSGGGALKRHGKSRGNVSGGTAGAASAALGGVPRRCYQPRHLPLPLNPSTRVTFAYELTSIAIVVDASPSLTATTFETSNMFDSGGLSEEKNGYCVVPLDRLGSLLKTYLQGLVQPIDVPPVAVSGLGVSFLRWTPNLAVTVVAAYPRTSQGDHSSAGLLVRDFRVSDVNSALELARQVERWALREVEGAIAERLSGERNFLGDGVAGRNIGIDHDDPMYPMLTSLGSYHLPQTQHIGSSVKSSMKELLAVGDAALSTLPPEGRPMVLVVTDCQNIHCGGVFESLASTDRTDVPLSVLNLSAYGSHTLGGPGSSGAEFSPFALSVSDDSQSIRDACHISGGIFLHQTLLETCVNTSAGSPIDHSSPLHGDYHFERAKRSIRPNALQWYTLFTLSPFTPSGASSSSFSRNGTTIYRSGTTAPISRSISTKQHQSHDSIGSFAGYGRQISLSSIFDNNSKANDSAFVAGADVSFTAQVATQHERTVFSKYAIQPIRIKSLLMTRVLEGYHARRYGHNTQDPDKVSVHMVLCLTDCGIAVHYEVSFVSSPYHAPMVGTAHVKLELSGDDVDFIQTVKRMFISHHGADSIMQQGRRISAVSKAAAEKICKLLRWIRKEDYLESYLCLPGWGDINHFADGSSFLRRLESLTSLQRYRHFRSETLEAVIAGGSPFENRESLFGDIMEPNNGEDEMFSALSSWSTGIISDRKIYLKEVFPAQDDDLAYYCIVRVLQSPVVSRLFTFTLDFHGELDTEQRLMVLSSFRENLKGCTDIIVLKKTISENIAIRPSSPSHLWHPGKREYFLHHKSWDLIKDTEVLPLITKRRSQIGNFFILHADDDRAVFAKFVQSDGLTTPDNLDIVIYQVLSRPDGIFVDIHMESCRSTFYPFYANDTIFHSIFEKVKRRDKECAKNLRSRTNVLAALDPGNFDQHAESQTEDVHRLIRVSTLTQRKLRFFRGSGSGSANATLYHLTTLHMTSPSFQNQAARLSIGPNQLVGKHCGTWFIMRVDWYVLSVIHFSLVDRVVSEEDSSSCRNLNFFTVGITDLYQSNDDVRNIDDCSENDSEHFGVSDIADEVEIAHGKNFSRALYLALRHKESLPVTSIHNEDVAYALKFCSFKEVLQAYVSLDDLSDQLGSEAEKMAGRKLSELIGCLLCPLPGSNDEIFYFQGDEVLDCEGGVTNRLAPSNLYGTDDDFSAEDEQSNILEKDVDDDDGDALSLEEEEKRTSVSDSDPPMFFRFTLDGKNVSLQDILTLKKSAYLCAQVTVFGKTQKLPPFHAGVISKLRNALNSFASEQTLEKHRFFGEDSLTQEAFKTIMRNLPQTKHHSLEIPLVFFVSRSDSLISASNPTGSSENELEHGFSILMTELERNENTIRASHTSYLVLDDAACRNVFPFWCFIQVRKDRGSIIVRVYHPSGEKAAEDQGELTRKLVETICHRTNQLLLLESLYRTKNASNLLIPEDDSTMDERGPDKLVDEENFSCPIQYRMPTPLNHRVAPTQAIVSLDSTVLQNFLVSNRRGIFTYKDESDNVFYMKLNCFKKPDAEEGEHNPHIIELQVYGVDYPGPSITEQLARLLQKKLLQLPLDFLGSVLKKNPYYQLLPADLAFLKQFRSAWRELEHESDTNFPESPRVYDLPHQIEDPVMLLLMFRQNISGSTFIQHLHESTEEKFAQVSDVMLKDDTHGDFKIKFLPKEFLFYFNSSPSQLDPNYQPVTTLTEKGRLFSRQAGSGIAIIQVQLLHGDGSPLEYIDIGKTEVSRSILRVSKSDVSLRSTRKDESNAASNVRFKIAVDIINTTVDIDVLHKWVELSLSQVLVAYCIERHLKGGSTNNAQWPKHYALAEQMKLESINQALPGLPALVDMLHLGVELPHPTIIEFKNEKMLRATVLASTLLSHLTAILSSIFNQKVIALSQYSYDIIRYTGIQNARKVNITSDHTKKNGVRVEILGKKKVLNDKPTDEPEYICVLGFGQHNDRKRHSHIQASQLFFKDINAVRPASEESASAFSQALAVIQKEKPWLFARKLVFILTVTRASRTLITYNINPGMLSSMKLRFMEIEEERAKADDLCRSGLRSRCLPFLPGDHSVKEAAVRPVETNAINKQREKNPMKDETIVERAPRRRIVRPTSMLRPTLIGKSVEGSAMQAVTASRLRASTRPTPIQRNVTSVSNAASQKAPRDKSKEKIGTIERKASGLQKKKRDSTISKDSTNKSISAPTPRTSQLKAFRDFLGLLKDGPEFLLSRPRLNQSALQLLAHTFLTPPKDKSLSFLTLRLIAICYGNTLRVGSVEQLRFEDASSAQSFLEFLTNRWATRDIFPLGGSIGKQTQKLRSGMAYFKKELLNSSSRGVTILIEISMQWNNARNSFVFGYKAWLVNRTDQSRTNKQNRSAAMLCKKPFASCGSIVREAAIIEAIALDFLNKFELESEVFNFAGFRLVRAVRGRDPTLNTLSLLKCAIARFCPKLQARLPGVGYRLQRRFLSPSSFLSGPLLGSCEKATLIQYLSEKATLIRCTGDDCFVGKSILEGFIVFYFIAWHESVQSAFDIFILCVTKGQCIDTYITKEGSPYAERISDVILFSSMTTVQQIITAATKDIRKQYLWGTFGKQHQSSKPCIDLTDHIQELRDVSYQIDLTSIDSRLHALLCDELSELQIPWRDVLLSIQQCPSFSHCITENSISSIYIIYCSDEDMFIDLELDQHSKVVEARVLSRDKIIMHGNDSNPTEMFQVRSVTEEFTNFLLQWIWSDTQVEF